jgi:hypothetical protein
MPNPPPKATPQAGATATASKKAADPPKAGATKSSGAPPAGSAKTPEPPEPPPPTLEALEDKQVKEERDLRGLRATLSEIGSNANTATSGGTIAGYVPGSDDLTPGDIAEHKKKVQELIKQAEANIADLKIQIGALKATADAKAKADDGVMSSGLTNLKFETPPAVPASPPAKPVPAGAGGPKEADPEQEEQPEEEEEAGEGDVPASDGGGGAGPPDLVPDITGDSIDDTTAEAKRRDEAKEVPSGPTSGGSGEVWGAENTPSSESTRAGQ